MHMHPSHPIALVQCSSCLMAFHLTPSPPFAQHPFGAPHVAIPHALRESGEGGWRSKEARGGASRPERGGGHCGRASRRKGLWGGRSGTSSQALSTSRCREVESDERSHP